MLEDTFPYFDEVLEFRRSLTPETDRGCALMAAAFLHDQLERLLRGLFVDDMPVIEELLKPMGPLGSFAARIELAYALGKLPTYARRDLHLIRKIRNDFGHVAKPINFEDSPIVDRCRELHHTAHEPDAPPRGHFTNAVLGVAAIIHHQLATTVRSTIPKDVSLSEKAKQQCRELAMRIARSATEGKKGTSNEGMHPAAQKPAAGDA